MTTKALIVILLLQCLPLFGRVRTACVQFSCPSIGMVNTLFIWVLLEIRPRSLCHSFRVPLSIVTRQLVKALSILGLPYRKRIRMGYSPLSQINKQAFSMFLPVLPIATVNGLYVLLTITALPFMEAFWIGTSPYPVGFKSASFTAPLVFEKLSLLLFDATARTSLFARFLPIWYAAHMPRNKPNGAALDIPVAAGGVFSKFSGLSTTALAKVRAIKGKLDGGWYTSHVMTSHSGCGRAGDVSASPGFLMPNYSMNRGGVCG